MAGDGLGLSVLSVLADAGAQKHRARQSGPTAQGMHGGVSREIHEAHLGKPSAAPDPMSQDGIDDQSENKRENDKGNVLDPLGHGAGHDGSGGAAEDELEEELAPERHGRGQRLVIEG